MKPNPEVIRRMEAGKWFYAALDDVAFFEIRRRIEECGRERRAPLTYSDVAAGVEFRIPSLSQTPLIIDVHAWRDLDRDIVGEFLGRLSLESYRNHGFMASALVVHKDEENRRPSKHFFNWMRETGALKGKSESAETEFWIEQLHMAYDFYARA